MLDSFVPIAFPTIRTALDNELLYYSWNVWQSEWASDILFESRADLDLLVDDEIGYLDVLAKRLTRRGFEVTTASSGSEAIRALRQWEFDLAVVDLKMEDMDGIEILKIFKKMDPDLAVIILTGHGSEQAAREGIEKGAFDYLTKPLDFETLRLTVERAMEHIRLKEENRILKETLGKHFDMQNIIGHSPAMITLLETVAQVAPSEATVMITGESGTGKELIAGVIHFNSSRKDGPFIKINCAAITETLLESELFGHEKGAFTGADRRKEGRFYQAHGGTLFLDEVSEMPLSMQVKLLRVLQERELTRVGGEKVITVDVRVIAATNKNLSELKAKGLFREDLYYRLHVVELKVPPLSERKEDIPLLAEHFLQRFSQAILKDFLD